MQAKRHIFLKMFAGIDLLVVAYAVINMLAAAYEWYFVKECSSDFQGTVSCGRAVGANGFEVFDAFVGTAAVFIVALVLSYPYYRFLKTNPSGNGRKFIKIAALANPVTVGLFAVFVLWLHLTGAA